MEHVNYFRHALALDERRVKFLPEYVYEGSSLPDSEGGADEESGADDGSGARDESGADDGSSAGDESRADDENGTVNEDESGVDGERRQRVRQDNLPHTKEVWFAGTHSDM